MEFQPHPSQLVAVDSNVPLDLADGNESVLDALNTIRKGVTPFQSKFLSVDHAAKFLTKAYRNKTPIATGASGWARIAAFPSFREARFAYQWPRERDHCHGA